jgi:hypothetical protein
MDGIEFHCDALHHAFVVAFGLESEASPSVSLIGSYVANI